MLQRQEISIRQDVAEEVMRRAYNNVSSQARRPACQGSSANGNGHRLNYLKLSGNKLIKSTFRSICNQLPKVMLSLPLRRLHRFQLGSMALGVHTDYHNLYALFKTAPTAPCTEIPGTKLTASRSSC